MSASSSKHDNSLDKSNDEAPKDIYCKNTVPILIQNATDHFMIKKVTQELEMEHLAREHAAIDKKIAAMLEKSKKTRAESEKLDRQIFDATQMANQRKVRVKKTGEILNVLREEAETLQSHAKRLESTRLDITKKVQDAAQQTKQNEERKKQIKDLEAKIDALLNEPEISLDKIIKENEKLKEILEQKKEAYEESLMKKNKIAQMKEERVNLLKQITKKQEENKSKKEEIEKRKENTKKVMKEKETKWREQEEMLNNTAAKRDELRKKLTESIKSCEEKQLKSEKLKASIKQKEEELKNLKEKCAVRQAMIKEDNEKKQQEYEEEKKKLSEIENMLQAQLEENAQNLSILNQKTTELDNLKARKEELTVQLCDKKIELITRRYENKELENNMISDKIRSEQREVEKLKTKIEELEKRRQEAKTKLEEYPQELEKQRREIEENHKEKIEGLLKRQNFHKATAEFVQHALDDNLKKVEELQQEIKGLEVEIDWEEMSYYRRERTLNTLKAKTKTEQLAYEKLLEQIKQKENQNTYVTEAEKNVAVDQDQDIAPGEKKITGILKTKRPIEALQESEPMDDENGARASGNGRKSPRTLKTFNRPKTPTTSPKRVTFKGLSSTESSSASTEANKEVNNSQDINISEEGLKKGTETSKCN